MLLNDVTYIFTHFEMGDSIICNGLIRNLSNIYKKIILFSKMEHKKSMEWMYRDMTNIEFLFFENYLQAEEFIKMVNPQPLHRIGFQLISDHKNLVKENCQFDEMYYKQTNIPFSKRWSDFYVKRDKNREYDFFKTFDIEEKKYIFVHNTFSNCNPEFNFNHVSKKFPVVKPIVGRTENIFDYLYLIENAYEIHCVCSSFKNLIDSFDIPSDIPLFFHINRPTFSHSKKWISSSKLPWKNIQYF